MTPTILSLLSTLAALIAQLVPVTENGASAVLRLVSSLLKNGEEAEEELRALTEFVRKLVDEDREATMEEWLDLRARVRADVEAIRGTDLGDDDVPF